MADTFTELNHDHIEFIKNQKLFFVASAPSDPGNGFVNVSPKGYDTLETLDTKTIVYSDYPGSGNETATHMAENRRLTMMFISFDKKPLVLRLYGKGKAIALDTEEGIRLKDRLGTKVSKYSRQLIVLEIEKVKTSCGFGIPYYRYLGERETLGEWCKRAFFAGKIKKYMGFLWKG